MELELSHNLLIKKDQDRYVIFIVEKKTFSEGAFGAVYDTPDQLILNTTTNELTFSPCPNVTKHILNHGWHIEESVTNEFNLIKFYLI